LNVAVLNKERTTGEPPVILRRGRIYYGVSDEVSVESFFESSQDASQPEGPHPKKVDI